MIHKWNCEGYYKGVGITLHRERHSLTFDILMDTYNGYAIKAVNGDQLPYYSMVWDGKYYGYISDC